MNVILEGLWTANRFWPFTAQDLFL